MSEYFIDYNGSKWFRYGKLKVSGSFLLEKPELVFRAFQEIRFLPTKIEHDLVSNTFTYYGLSPAFKPISRKEPPPEYQLHISVKSFLGAEEVSVKVTKQD